MPRFISWYYCFSPIISLYIPLQLHSIRMHQIAHARPTMPCILLVYGLRLFIVVYKSYNVHRNFFTCLYHQSYCCYWIMHVGQHRSHIFGKSIFPWQYAFKSVGICLHKRVYTYGQNMGIPKKSDNKKVDKIVEVHFHNSSSPPCCCCDSTHVSNKLNRVEKRNFVE